ncbi:MAG: DotI/IcmL family type IV secretion protein [Candidatus Berkiella sp.]
MTSSASDSGHKPSSPETKTPHPTRTHKPGQNVIFSRSMLHGDPFYTTLLFCSLIMIGSCLVLFAWDFYARTHKDSPVYYAITSDEKLIRLRALRAPNMSTEALLEWVSEAATTVYTLNFNNYNQVIRNVRPFFTEPGYENFQSAIRAAGIINTIVKKRLVVSAVVTDTPVILKEGIINGFYAWQVQFPMLLTYQSASDQIQSKIILTLLITRVPTTESVKGIGIASFIVTSAS